MLCRLKKVAGDNKTPLFPPCAQCSGSSLSPPTAARGGGTSSSRTPSHGAFCRSVSEAACPRQPPGPQATRATPQHPLAHVGIHSVPPTPRLPTLRPPVLACVWRLSASITCCNVFLSSVFVPGHRERASVGPRRVPPRSVHPRPGGTGRHPRGAAAREPRCNTSERSDGALLDAALPKPHGAANSARGSLRHSFERCWFALAAFHDSIAPIPPPPPQFPSVRARVPPPFALPPNNSLREVGRRALCPAAPCTPEQHEWAVGPLRLCCRPLPASRSLFFCVTVRPSCVSACLLTGPLRRMSASTTTSCASSDRSQSSSSSATICACRCRPLPSSLPARRRRAHSSACGCKSFRLPTARSAPLPPFASILWPASSLLLLPTPHMHPPLYHPSQPTASPLVTQRVHRGLRWEPCRA